MSVNWNISGEYGGAFIRAKDANTPYKDIGKTLDRRFEFEWPIGSTVTVEVVAFNLAGEAGDLKTKTVGTFRMALNIRAFGTSRGQWRSWWEENKHKPLLVKDGEDFGAVVDSVGVCKSGGTFVLAEIYWPDIAAALEAATGMEMPVERLKRIGERIYNLQRCYNAWHGITRADDRLPRRFTEDPSPSGNAQGQVIDLEPMLEEYYRLRGWDPETGWPTEEKLRELGLEEANP